MTSQDTRRRDATIDIAEVGRFDQLGAQWWNPEGPMRALHKLNPVRVAYLRELLSGHFLLERKPRDFRAPAPLQGLKILDIGCGAGILSEPLARLGASMTSIDPSRRNIEIAAEHAAKAGLAIDYRCVSAEGLAETGTVFDAVLAMEVIEHVRDLPRFLNEAARMVRPGGMFVVATLNRTLKSFAFAIVGAEYVLNWVPRGTHNWNRFVTPRELAKALHGGGLHVKREIGVTYNPLAARWQLSHDTDINYMMAAVRPQQ